MRRNGFTLIEVLVALTLGAMLVLAAHEAFGGALDISGRLDARRADVAQEVRGRAWLTRAIGNLDPAGPGSVGFDGSPDAMRFTTRLRSADGSFAAATFRLHAAGGWLVATPEAAGAPAVRLCACASVRLDYLLDTGADARWVAAWHSPVSAPLAIRLRLAREGGAADTLLFTVGPRG